MTALRLPLLLVLAFLTACGGSPPSSQVEADIKKAVMVSNTAMFEGSEKSCEVTDISVAKWQKEKLPQGGPTMYESTWKAKLRFKEPVAFIVAEVDGKNIVKVVADKGETLAFEGFCGGVNVEGKWQTHANAQSNGSGDILGAGVWKTIFDRAQGLTMGYAVITNGMQSGTKFRRANFDSLSALQPCIVEGSEEYKKLQTEMAERAQKAQAAALEQQRKRQEQIEAQQKQAQAEAAERQRKYEEEQARLRAEAAEKQRLAQEEYQRQQAERAEQQRLAQEAAKKKADDERHARLLAVMKPLQSATGAVITAEAGPTLGTVILDTTIDDAALKVTGHAIDLREMPFKEFTFEGAVDERGAFSFKSSLGGDPVVYGAAGDKLSSRAGFTISGLAEADRAKMETLIALGKRLGSASAAELKLETLDAEGAKAKEPQLRMTGLSGSVFYRGKLNPAVAPLLSADMASNKAYAWKNKEVVSVRLAEPVKGTGIFIRGTAAPSTEMIVTINGVHKITVPAIPKLGDVIIGLPAGLEVLDVKFEATGAVSARTIGLTK